MQSTIGWIALVVFAFIFVAQFYVYYGARRVIKRIIKEGKDNEVVNEASTANDGTARTRLKWLRKNISNMSADINSSLDKVLLIDTLSYALFGVLILLWALAMMID